MVKRQYAGELTEIMSPRASDKDSESTPPESTPSSPGLDVNVPSLSQTGGSSSSGGSSPRQRSSYSEGVQDEESLAISRSFYQLQAQQIYLAHQKLTESDNDLKEKDRTKKSISRSSLISRKFRRLSRSESLSSSPEPTQPLHQPQRHSLSDIESSSMYDPSLGNLMGGIIPGSSKRASTGSLPITGPGSLLRWMFNSASNSASSSKMSTTGSSASSSFYAGSTVSLDRNGENIGGSTYSLASQSSASSTLTLMMNNEGHSEFYRNGGSGGRSFSSPQLTSQMRYVQVSKRYPEHLNTYAGRSLPEHAAVLNEYVDWLAQCHAYGIKTRMSYAVNGALASQSQPGGVPGIGLGSNATGGMSSSGGLGDMLGDFSVFSLSVGGVMNASIIAGHHEEWISPGMAQMMMLRFPGLVVEWPKFWNNTREASGPPPGPIDTLPAMAVVNNPAFSLGKGNAGGVGGGISAGAGGPFGGNGLNGSSGNGPSALRHQQQAQMHHQQQMQLWSRNAAVASAAAATAAATAAAAAHVSTAASTDAAMTKAAMATFSSAPINATSASPSPTPSSLSRANAQGLMNPGNSTEATAFMAGKYL